eukprot:SAG11_NODE_25952_length_351_cov_2.095238_1_plen_34_part_01
MSDTILAILDVNRVKKLKLPLCLGQKNTTAVSVL